MGDQKIPEFGTMLVGRHVVKGNKVIGEFVRTFGSKGTAYVVTTLNGTHAVIDAASAVAYTVTENSEVAAAVRVLVDAGIDSAAKFDQLIATVTS